MIPHPFSPQECDNEEMDQDSKPLQNRKDQRVVRERLRLHSLLGILSKKVIMNADARALRPPL